MSDSAENTASIGFQGTVSGDDMSNKDDNLQQEPTPPESQEEQERHMQSKEPPITTDGPSERLWIRYRTEYRDRYTNTVVWEKKSRQPIVDASDGTDAHQDPIFEVLTVYSTRDDTTAAKRFPENSAENGQEDKRDGPPPRSSVTPATHSLRIYSPAIRNALNSVVKYYPSQSLAGDVIEIRWPYPLLVHHYDQLAEFRNQVTSKDPSDVCDREKHAPEDVEALLKFLDHTVMGDIRAEMSRNERGFFSSENIWYALKPGTTIMTRSKERNDWRPCVISEVSGGTLLDPQNPGDWLTKGWSFAFDGMYLDRVERKMWWAFFGEQSFEDSGIRFISGSENIEDEEVRKLVDHGKTYWRLAQKQCKYHSGNSCNFPYNKVEGLVMTDMQQYYKAGTAPKPDFLDNSDIRRWRKDCTYAACKRRTMNLQEARTEFMFEGYYHITHIIAPELGTHQYLLCPFEIPAFVFKTRSWDTFHVANFKEPDFQRQMINSLVIDEDRIITLKALAQSFIRVNKDGKLIQRKAWAADFVKGKGSGMTFLLHGKPGAGKTYTAECIAEYTRRPLMTLTSSDVGTDPSSVEFNLTLHFKIAKSWGAVLVIDEADVFMERRTTNDLTRNSLVAGFLRAIEFYDGLLFLTTNRVGAFDDAFISRVHIQLYYRDFTDSERQKIWKTFLDKLQDDSMDTESGKPYMRVSLLAQEYIEGDQVRAMKWNGREIRNAFQTAVSLAEHENKQDKEGTILLTDHHLRSVLALSKDFKSYLTELHQGDDEARRAQRRRERLDDFGDAPEISKRT